MSYVLIKDSSAILAAYTATKVSLFKSISQQATAQAQLGVASRSRTISMLNFQFSVTYSILSAIAIAIVLSTSVMHTGPSLDPIFPIECTSNARNPQHYEQLLCPMSSRETEQDFCHLSGILNKQTRIPHQILSCYKNQYFQTRGLKSHQQQ